MKQNSAAVGDLLSTHRDQVLAEWQAELAAAGGNPASPAWYNNIVKHPEVEVVITYETLDPFLHSPVV